MMNIPDNYKINPKKNFLFNLDLEKIDFAFQPIVNTYSGKIFAVEALIRNTDKLGFNTIQDFFDYLAEHKLLFEIDIQLRKKAFKKYSIININNLKLFYNVDNRYFAMPDYKVGETLKILDELKIKNENICFELTEHETGERDDQFIKNIINIYKEYNFNIAIDDFGTGISGLHLLYISDTNFIKIDRFFIEKIDLDPKKRLFCASMIEMAHIMGIKVIAEGIETAPEYFCCKEIKVDYIQGYLISRPILDIKTIKKTYTHERLFKNDRRASNSNLIDKSYIDKIDPLNINSSLHKLFTYFKEHTLNTFVPIIDDNKKIIGAIYEIDIKKISYSQYGLSLAKNNSTRGKLKTFIRPVLEIDIAWGIDKALEIFNMRTDAKGIFVSKNSKYNGFISLNNLVSLSYKRNLEIAQNQNPLTKLPGNNQIDKFISSVFEKNMYAQIVYFDFNDFKPFNDTYGFRQGDRAILMFSEVLQKNISSDNFIAHIGGDDFFVGFIGSSYEETYNTIHNIQEEFKLNASSLYNEKDLSKGYILAKDRFGTNRKFALLSVCAAIVDIGPKSTQEAYNSILGEIKKKSKEFDYPFGTCIPL